MGRKFYIIMILLFTCLLCGCADRQIQGNSSGEDSSFDMGKASEEKQPVDDDYPAGLHGFAPPQVRLISVNGPVDVTVYDAGGNIVAATVGEEPMRDGDLVTSITRAGEKLVYLPVYRNYTVQLTATADGVMHYVEVTQFSFNLYKAPKE